ncbi:oxalate:formate antiporter-like [Mercenaria mercenaria]|uniref:oxalate:formate antiporter-like n=1 Tax=Mercenaria mercenaria TaxID=6596 RepID=UPI00234F7FC6|nr:oxalate:formate antiporter-like [Mercenaria mercenaria]
MEYENKEMSTEDSIPKELSIMEAIKFALRCRSFYVVWLTIMLMNGGMQFINGLYKAYELTFIDDDHFLALVGSLAAVFNCIGRPIWGAVMDKTGFRVAIRCVSGGFVILLATLLLTEYLPKYLFLVWICALYFFFCGIWSIMPATLAKLLGPQHMAINYGIIYTGLSLVSILGSLFGTSLKAVIGWHGLFYMAAGLGALVFLISFLFNGVDRKGKRI